jgi:Tfp pilus assembly protein PilF
MIESVKMLGNMGVDDRALALAEGAKTLTSDSAILSMCFRIDCQIYLRLGNVQESMASAGEALRLLPHNCDATEEFKIKNVLGVIETLRGQFSEAFLHFTRCLSLADEIKDESLEVSVLANLGLLYYKMFDYESAIQCWEKALDLKMDDAYRVNLSLAYINSGSYGRASALLDEARNGLDTMEPRTRINFFYAVGTLFDSLGRTDSAAVCFDSSYRLAKPVDPRFAAENLLSLARVHLKCGRLKIGEQFLDSVQEVAGKMDFQDVLLRYYWERIRLSAFKHDLEGRIRAQDKYLIHRDAFYDFRMAHIAATQKERFRELDQKKNILINQSRLDASVRLAVLQTRFKVVSLTVAIMLLVSIVLLIYQIKTRTKHKSILEEAVNARVSSCEERNSMLERIIEIREKRKQRIEKRLDGISEHFPITT